MLLSLLLATTYACATPAGHAGAPNGVEARDSIRRFPRVVGTNLEGRRFSLPDDFGSDYSVVIVAFRREQQADVDTWLPFLRDQQFAQRGVGVYELPTLKRSYRLMRGVIDGGMARGIPDKATRETTITLYIDKSPFKQALAIPREDCIRAMLVMRDGRVLWHADGRFTEEAGQELSKLLATHAPRPG